VRPIYPLDHVGFAVLLIDHGGVVGSAGFPEHDPVSLLDHAQLPSVSVTRTAGRRREIIEADA
jgi:hypothetical protein